RLVRLQRHRPPAPAHGSLAHPARRGHRPRRPVRRTGRLLLERLHDHPLNLLVADRARLPRPRLVMQPVEATPREPAPPLPDRVVVTAKLGRDLLARPTFRRRPDYPAAKGE